MRIEHVALNVADPVKMAEWYGKQIGMKVMRSGNPPVNGRFLADEVGNVILEVYNNPPNAVPDYRRMDPLLLHVAFASADVKADHDKLVAAGAVSVSAPTVVDNGDALAMLRDPWGLAIQLCKRVSPMLRKA